MRDDVPAILRGARENGWRAAINVSRKVETNKAIVGLVKKIGEERSVTSKKNCGAKMERGHGTTTE